MDGVQGLVRGRAEVVIPKHNHSIFYASAEVVSIASTSKCICVEN